MSRCAALVKNGGRCTRTGVSTISGYMYCKQHAKIHQSRPPPDLTLLKKLREKDQEHMHQMFGYKMMGVKYVGFGGRRATCAKKQTVYTWLLTANRMKNEKRLTQDLINEITYVLLWYYM